MLDHEYDEESAPTIIDAAKDSDFTIWDGMFTDEELKMRKGWGHSSISQGAEFLVSTNAKKLAICHHSPYRNDKEMMILERDVVNKNLFLAREGQIIKI